MEIAERIKKLRELMREKGLDAYIIPSSDEHQSEYVAEYFRCREWISGFTGSAGTVVITLDDAGLWTDGRYYIQAEKQLRGSGIKLFRAAELNTPTYSKWLFNKLDAGSCVGFYGMLLSVNQVKSMQQDFKTKNLKINFEFDLINQIWENRPLMPRSKVFLHDPKYAGASCKMKLECVRKEMSTLDCNAFFLSSLDDIAWLFNIRANDVRNNPVVIAYALVCEKECYLFVDKTKLDDESRKELSISGVVIKDYDEVKEITTMLSDEAKVVMDYSKTSFSLYSLISERYNIIDSLNVTTKLKAVKNEIEIKNLRECQLFEGTVLVKLIKWLKENAAINEINEIDVDSKLIDLRKECDLYFEPSFDSIVGYKENAAMMHYKAEPNNARTITNSGMLLIDTGGQYYNGTTDTTRTVVLGDISDEEKRDFTLVLKSHIALAKAIFLYGITGTNIDILARRPLWEEGIDYKCGTGHGVGYFLNVHEGPHRISTAANDVKLEEGMIVTNEPGVYKENKYGIRTENMMLIIPYKENEFGKFMAFEPITYCPIDAQGIEVSLLTEQEKDWLNDYHKDVFEKLSPMLNKKEREWLCSATAPII